MQNTVRHLYREIKLGDSNGSENFASSPGLTMISAKTALWLSFALITAPLAAESPARVRFDVVSPIAAFESQMESRADTKLVGIEVEVSAFFENIGSEDVESLLIQVESSDPDFRIVDQSPKTMTSTDIDGVIRHSETRTRSLSLDADATGYYRYLTGAFATGAFHTSQSSNETYDKLAPRETVMASGTLAGGRTAYFKLRANSQTSLEGKKSYRLLAETPIDWRGETLRIGIQAKGRARRTLDGRAVPSFVESSKWVVPVYLESVPRARDAAIRFASAEARLRRTAHDQRDSMKSGGKPRFGFGDRGQRIPEDWLDQCLTGNLATDTRSRLPKAIREASEAYERARREFYWIRN